MITKDTRFGQLATAAVKTVNVRFVDGSDLTGAHDFASSDDLISVDQTSLGNFIGFATKKMVAKITTSMLDIQNHHYDVYLGLLDPLTNAFDEIYLGQYIVTDVPELDASTGQTTITLYDSIYVATNTPYSLNDSLFPLTVQALAGALATSFGTALSFSSSLPNASLSIPVNLWKTIDNATMADVVQSIAETTGTTARITGDTLTFAQYALNAETVVEDNLISFTIGGHWGVLNSVVLSRMPQNDNIVENNDASVTAHGLTALTIVNNQIMDADRADDIQPIYNALIGTTPYIVQDDLTMTTEGHGWYEIGDTFTVTIGGVNYFPIITEIDLSIDGGFTEKIISVIPDPTDVNYATAGGILKSVYDTEIQVNKQNNTITSIVSRQDTTDATVATNFTELQQDIANITEIVQTQGGDNILENSVGYATNTDGTLSSWTLTGTGTITTQSSPGSLQYGGVSGYEIDVAGTSAALTQRIPVTIGQSYSLSLRAKKNSTGSAKIKLSNTTDDFEVNLLASTAYAWEEFKIENFIPTVNYLDVAISSASADSFSITDLMINIGQTAATWTQAADEVMSQYVVVNKNGMTIKSSLYPGDFTQITPLSFSGYSSVSGSQQQVFSLNRDVTTVSTLQAANGIKMLPLKIVPITTGTIQGWAFVKTT